MWTELLDLSEAEVELRELSRAAAALLEVIWRHSPHASAQLQQRGAELSLVCGPHAWPAPEWAMTAERLLRGEDPELFSPDREVSPTDKVLLNWNGRPEHPQERSGALLEFRIHGALRRSLEAAARQSLREGMKDMALDLMGRGRRRAARAGSTETMPERPTLELQRAESWTSRLARSSFPELTLIAGVSQLWGALAPHLTQSLPLATALTALAGATVLTALRRAQRRASSADPGVTRAVTLITLGLSLMQGVAAIGVEMSDIADLMNMAQWGLIGMNLVLLGAALDIVPHLRVRAAGTLAWNGTWWWDATARTLAQLDDSAHSNSPYGSYRQDLAGQAALSARLLEEAEPTWSLMGHREIRVPVTRAAPATQHWTPRSADHWAEKRALKTADRAALPGRTPLSQELRRAATQANELARRDAKEQLEG